MYEQFRGVIDYLVQGGTVLQNGAFVGKPLNLVNNAASPQAKQLMEQAFSQGVIQTMMDPATNTNYIVVSESVVSALGLSMPFLSNNTPPSFSTVAPNDVPKNDDNDEELEEIEDAGWLPLGLALGGLILSIGAFFMIAKPFPDQKLAPPIAAILFACALILTVIGSWISFRRSDSMINRVGSLFSMFVTICLAVFCFTFVSSMKQIDRPEPAKSAQTSNSTSDKAGSEEQSSEKRDEKDVKELIDHTTLTYKSYGNVQVDGKDGVQFEIASTLPEEGVYNFSIQAYNADGKPIGDPEFLLRGTLNPKEKAVMFGYDDVPEAIAKQLKEQGVTYQIVDMVTAKD